MPDDSNLPPINADAPNPVPDESTPAPLGQDAPTDLTFTPEQLDSLGLTDAQPGQSFTITVEAGDAGEDGAPSFTVTSTAPDTGDDPDASDLADISPTNDSAPEDDKSPMGFSRKPKAPRAGLPDTKKLRDI